jgi:hypothetical protein
MVVATAIAVAEVALALVLDATILLITTHSSSHSSHHMASPRAVLCHKRKAVPHLQQILPLTHMLRTVVTKTTLRCGIRLLLSSNSRVVRLLQELHKVLHPLLR